MEICPVCGSSVFFNGVCGNCQKNAQQSIKKWRRGDNTKTQLDWGVKGSKDNEEHHTLHPIITPIPVNKFSHAINGVWVSQNLHQTVIINTESGYYIRRLKGDEFEITYTWRLISEKGEILSCLIGEKLVEVRASENGMVFFKYGNHQVGFYRYYKHEIRLLCPSCFYHTRVPSPRCWNCEQEFR